GDRHVHQLDAGAEAKPLTILLLRRGGGERGGDGHPQGRRRESMPKPLDHAFSSWLHGRLPLATAGDTSWRRSRCSMGPSLVLNVTRYRRTSLAPLTRTTK